MQRVPLNYEHGDGGERCLEIGMWRDERGERGAGEELWKVYIERFVSDRFDYVVCDFSKED